MYTLKAFADEHGHRMWHDRHLMNSLRMIKKVSTFRDFATRPITDFKPTDIEALMDSLAEEGLKDGTINRYLSAISSVFKEAVRKEVVTHAPSVRWKKESKGRPRYYTAKEVKDIIDFLKTSRDPWMADFVVIAVNTGMRLGEILGINNLDSKTYGKVSDCGSFVTLFDTKNGDERLVPLNKDAQWALENLMGTPSSYYTHARFYRTWWEAKDELARHDENFVFHVLRHTCATRLAMEFNVESLTIGKILGHRSTQTTQKYVHVQPDSIKAVMQKLENY